MTADCPTSRCRRVLCGCSFPQMPTACITVTAVSDEGDNVIVWGRRAHAAHDSQPIGFVFQAKGERAEIRLAEQASRLARGTQAVIDYTSVADDWNVARGLIVS